MTVSPFDLRRFAPPAETTFQLKKHGDHVFAVDGDPDIEDVARMLRIENVVRGIDEGDSAAALLEGKQLLLRMVQELQPDVTDMKIGPQELIVVFSLIVKGPTVAEAVMEAITASSIDAAEGRKPGDPDIPDGEPREDGDSVGAPLASAKASSEASSSSDDPDASLLATGTG